MHAFHLAVSLLRILSSRHMCIRAQRYVNRDALCQVEKLAVTEISNSNLWLNTRKLTHSNRLSFPGTVLALPLTLPHPKIPSPLRLGHTTV